MKIQPQNKISIVGGHVFDPSQQLDGVMDIFIENDTIVAIGQAPSGFQPVETIDASGKMIFPGFIDTNMNFGSKTSIANETQAASRSGFTTLCSSPDNKPVQDTAASAILLKEKAKQAGFCSVLPIGALTANLEGEQLSNMYALKDAGCIALSQADAAFKDARVIQQCYLYAAGFDITVIITPLDTALAHGGCMHEGSTSTKLGLAGIPTSAETSSLAQHLILCEETGVKMHVSRITSQRALEMIVEAQANGLPVTADVAIGNLIFTDEDVKGYNSAMHVVPVYRSEQDRLALLAGVNAGQLSICSNHRPTEMAAKMAPFSDSVSGISVLDSFTNVLLDLVHSEQLTLTAAINAVTHGPANAFNLSVGSLIVEGQASLCMVDLTELSHHTLSSLTSKGQNNPWLNEPLPGKVSCTINQGHIVYRA